MLRKLAAGTGAALVAAGLAAAPAVATRLPNTPEESCGDVPHSEQNGLVKVTAPADGSPVDPGDAIDVTLKWSDGLLDVAVLDRALDCVEIDGTAAPGLSLDEQGVPNRSPMTHRYRIPSGLAPGTRICDQGFLFGPPADVPQRLASNRVCFTVGPPAPILPTAPPGRPAVPPGGGPGGATPPSTSPAAPPEAPGPGGSGLPPSGGSGPGGPGSPGPGLPPGGGGRVPSADTSVAVPPPLSPPATAPATSPGASTRPAEGARSPAGAPAETPPNLPRTGRDDRPLAVAGGANLIAAGLALIAGARHRRQRRP